MKIRNKRKIYLKKAATGKSNCILKNGGEPAYRQAGISRFSYSKIEWVKIRKTI